MKLRLSLLLAAVLAAGSLAAQAVTKADDATALLTPTKSKAPGAQFAESISTVTGVAISPLLGTSAYGAVHYYRTPIEKRHTLPWFAQPWFWGPALALVGLCFLKDTAGTALPTALKKPLDVAETVEHKVSGLIAAGAFVPFVAMLMQDPNGPSRWRIIGPSPVWTSARATSRSCCTPGAGATPRPWIAWCRWSIRTCRDSRMPT